MQTIEQVQRYKNVVEVSSLAGKAALSVLRDVNTQPGMGGFVQASDRAAIVLATEMTKTFETIGFTVNTPMGVSAGAHRFVPNVVLVPVLRAGLALQRPFWEFLPEARVQHLGMARNEQTAIAESYYPDPKKKLCIYKGDIVVLLDPMLATGGTACDALKVIVPYGPSKVLFANVIAAPEGIERVEAEHPEVKIFTLHIDSHLDGRKYIVPGLGDYGDRYFGTI